MSTDFPQRRGIIAGGNWIIDQHKVIDAWPPQDALANILSQGWGNGGSPYNILKALARLEAPFPLEGIGLVGEDANGALILEDAAAHGIDTRQLRRTDRAATSYTDVMTVKESGRRTFFHQRGANALLAPGDFDFTATNARFFHLGYLLLLDALDELVNGVPRAVEVLQTAREAGLVTSVDCVSDHSGRFESVIRPVLPHVDLLFINDLEAERLTGIRFRPDEGLNRKSVESAARALEEMGARGQIFLHFPEGAYTCGPEGRYWLPSVRLPAGYIQGAAGAGDAFAAGVLYGWQEGWGAERAVEFGNCVAAASLSHVSCSEGIGKNCLELVGKYGLNAPIT